MRRIDLTKNMAALVDNADYDYLNSFVWYAAVRKTQVYACTTIDGQDAMMHNILMPHSNDILVDHIDRNGLNNQRANLRYGTKSTNAHNKTKQGATSIYRGVCWASHNRRWKAQIKKDGVLYQLGHYRTEYEAARARDTKAIELYGTYAVLNFPMEVANETY